MIDYEISFQPPKTDGGEYLNAIFSRQAASAKAEITIKRHIHPSDDEAIVRVGYEGSVDELRTVVDSLMARFRESSTNIDVRKAPREPGVIETVGVSSDYV